MSATTTAALPYQIVVAWSAADEAYEARVPAIRNCLAYGSTPAKAVKEVTLAAEAMLEALAEAGKPVPAAEVNLDGFRAMAPILNLSAFAREANIPGTTLASKLQRGTDFTQEEAKKIAGVILGHGLAIPTLASAFVEMKGFGVTAAGNVLNRAGTGSFLPTQAAKTLQPKTSQNKVLENAAKRGG